MGLLDLPGVSRVQFLREAPLDVRRYGADDSGASDSRSAIQSALNAARDAGGGDVLLDGIYRVDAPILPRSNVRIRGRGWGKSILRPPSTWNGGSTGSILEVGGSAGSPITGFACSGVKFDLSQVPSTVQAKALFVTYMRDLRFEDNWVYQSTATGIGADFLDAGVIRGNRVEGCGRYAEGNEDTYLGCSGIGIGTGVWGSEATLVEGNFVINPVRYGIFTEYQSGISGYFTWGCKIINNYITGARWGIGSDGVADQHIIGNHVEASDQDAIVIAPGNAGGRSWGDLIAHNTVRTSGRHGLYVNLAASGNGTPAEVGRYVIQSNRFFDNASCGIKFSTSALLPGVMLLDNGIFRNAVIGIDIGGGGLSDGMIARNIITNNVNSGMRWLGPLTRMAIKDNRIGDTRTSGRTQQIGIDHQSGYTITDCVIEGNNLSNNITTGFQRSGTTTTSVIRRNFGYGPDAVDSVSLTGSPMTYTVGARPERLAIIGGTVASVAINGQTWLTGPGTVDLEPNDVMVLTYSADPTAIKRRRL